MNQPSSKANTTEAPEPPTQRWPVVDTLLGLGVLALLLYYSYALFFLVPYVGFYMENPSGQIGKVYVPGDLAVGDQLIKAGTVSLEDFNRNIRLPLIATDKAGDVIPLTLLRQGQTLTVDWQLPGPTQADIVDRLSNQWWLGYIFWIAGQAALLFLRPRDRRQRVFAAFNFITAIWLSASSLSKSHVGESAVVLHAAFWLSVPIYWQMHWLLRKPLARVPAWVAYAGYGVAGLLALAEFFQLLPPNAYIVGFLLALLGSIGLVIAHFVLRPAERRDVALLVGGILLTIGLLVVLALFGAAGAARGALFTLLVLPLLPIVYFYAAQRGQLAGLQVRTNRVITLYLFTVLLATCLALTIPPLMTWLNFPGGADLVALAAAGAGGLAVAVGFKPFERFVEQKILRIPLPPSHLLEAYAARITISLSEATLVQVLRDEILPSLLVRQSALLRFENGQFSSAYLQEVASADIPTPADIARLLTEVGRYRAPTVGQVCPWVRLALPLTIDRAVRGLWLLGRRDPDDVYGPEEIGVLESLANQTAIALTNISQAESLQALYQRDIEQGEAQRYGVARELHDHLLNEIAKLETSVDEATASPEFLAICESLIASIRQTISSLRPDALNYGLYHALVSLRDDLKGRAVAGLTIRFDELSGSARYAPAVELHVFRMVQQACENSLKHAAARTLNVRGELLDKQIDLWVEDDGKGFELADRADIAHLATQRHFGLANMFERAAITGATLTIETAPGQGTRVRVQWAG